MIRDHATMRKGMDYLRLSVVSIIPCLYEFVLLHM